MCKGTYTPKIREDLIPILYHLAKRKGMPMTRLVNEIIENYLHQMKGALRQMKAKEITKHLLEWRQNEKKKEDKKRNNSRPVERVPKGQTGDNGLREKVLYPPVKQHNDNSLHWQDCLP